MTLNKQAALASPSSPEVEYLKAPPPNLEKGVKGGRNFLEVVYTGFHLLLNLSTLDDTQMIPSYLEL